MSGSERNAKWRQGDLLPAEAVTSLFPEVTSDSTEFFAVVVSHHCDLAARESLEPDCEVIIGRRVEQLGGAAHGKISRKLTIEYSSQDTSVIIELEATKKVKISKNDLMKFNPREDLRLDGRGIRIIRDWLASRYNREAFPERFEEALRRGKVSSRKDVPDKIEEILDLAGDNIRTLLFNVDKGQFIERNIDAETYELGIYVVYESALGEEAFKCAIETAQQLENLFANTFEKEEGVKKGIKLLFCDPISDEAVSMAQRAELQEWKLDYLSYGNETEVV